MNISPKIGARLSALLFVLLFSSYAYAGSTKTSVCHVPPGNPDNFHTIMISAKALPAHLAHGDVDGACNEVCAIVCDDGNACTIDDDGMDCEQDGCAAPEAVDCNDSNECTTDSCDPFEGCMNTANVGDSCDTGETCSTNDTCNVDGVCEGEPIDNCCIDDTECSDDLCAREFCNPDNQCESDPVNCDDSDLCTVDACDALTGECVNGDVECGSDEQCDAGTGECLPIPVACPCFGADDLVLLGDLNPNQFCGDNHPATGDGTALAIYTDNSYACSGLGCTLPVELLSCKVVFASDGMEVIYENISEEKNAECRRLIVAHCQSNSDGPELSAASSSEEVTVKVFSN